MACDRCPLRRDAIGPTSYNSTMDAPLAVVGEGPGSEEHECGVPLVGPSGQLLDKALASVGDPRPWFIRPILSSAALKETDADGERRALHWLDGEKAFVRPKVIVALGSVELKYLMGPEARITRNRGRWFETKYEVPAITTYHPAYCCG